MCISNVVCVFNLLITQRMKFLIKVQKCFFYVSVCLFAFCAYGMLTQDFMWVVFALAAYSIAVMSHNSYKAMEADITNCMNSLTYDILKFCMDAEEDGMHVINLEYNGKWFTITLYYSCQIEEIIGASHMGDYEKIYERTAQYISILKMQCEDEKGEPYDYGFTAGDLQDKL